HYKTDQSGRALFVAPLDPGIIFGSIAGRPGRVPTTVISPTTEATNASVASAPRIASLADRFEVTGHGFCGDADSNAVNIGGHSAVVLASSPTSLVLLPPADLDPGAAAVKISCAKNAFASFLITFLALDLHADASPLSPNEHRKLTVTIAGSAAKIVLEAKNLAPGIAELVGGASVRQLSTGGQQNTAQFEVVGRRRGSFIISIHLVPVIGRPAS
ncbi:MAG: hypothetical protein M3N22_10050, partial [Acidobacteriota bacterium]|nr:hypothetical protein [Acidobacteriota bacterium]